MNTPAHLVIGLAAFGRPGDRRVTAAAIAGSLLPDLSLYLLAGVSLFVLGIPPERVFGELYFSDAWQAVFAIDNSFVIWGAVLALGLWRRNAVLVALSGAALLHLCFDFPLHHDDARMHFWPLSDWVFVSPVSYWDPAHHGGAVALLEIGLVLVLIAVLWTRFRSLRPRIGLGLLAAAEIAPGLAWAMMFG